MIDGAMAYLKFKGFVLVYSRAYCLTSKQILPSRLETLLELALRTSTANVDPFKDDLK